MRVLHVLYQSLPNNKGSSIRSRDIVAAQLRCGISPVVISSPFQEGFKPGERMEEYAGVRYYRTFNGDFRQVVSETRRRIFQRLSKALQILRFSRDVLLVARQEQVDVIHAHAMFFCGIAGWVAARRIGVPLVYEVRSLWEERPNQTSTYVDRLLSRALRFVETIVMGLADKVVVINKNLRDEIVGRGIPASKVVVIENGVDIDRVDSLCLESSLRRGRDLIFGYVGSISPIEGLDLLLESVKRLRAVGWHNPVLIYGDGPAFSQLKRIISDEALDGVELRGAFSAENVGQIYREIDVIVNPRRRSHLTDAVTPLKPLEAMAFQKLVIASDIGGMRELIVHQETGLLFAADDVEALSRVLMMAADSFDDYLAVIVAARAYVQASRSWSANGVRYANLYREIAG